MLVWLLGQFPQYLISAETATASQLFKVACPSFHKLKLLYFIRQMVAMRICSCSNTAFKITLQILLATLECNFAIGIFYPFSLCLSSFISLFKRTLARSSAISKWQLNAFRAWLSIDGFVTTLSPLTLYSKQWPNQNRYMETGLLIELPETEMEINATKTFLELISLIFLVK